MKTIIAGTRTLDDINLIKEAVRESGFTITKVIHGGARGIDNQALNWAMINDIEEEVFLPKWNDLSNSDAIIKVNKFGYKYDAKAGIRRNQEMAKNAEALIAIWDGVSKGTYNMIQEAKKNNLKVYIKKV